jgi:antitoxin (DNA-binding transcriptional repressor) of toxin-antitoxin stability system
LFAMKTVGIRELKNHLSGFVRQVRDGEEIKVTDRGKVVAELRPPTPPAALPAIHPGLAALARRGTLTLGQPNDSSLYAPLPPLLPAGSAAKLLSEERQERDER